MAKVKKKAEIKTFRDKYALAHEVSALENGTDERSEPDPDKREKNLKALLKAGYEFGLSVPGMIDVARHPSASRIDFTNPDHENHITLYRNAARVGAKASDEDASKYFFENSGDLIDQLNDKSAAKLVGNDEMRKRLPGKLQQWSAGFEQMNQAVVKAKGLEALVSAGGNVPKELREEVIEKVAEQNAKKTIEHYAKKGFNKTLQAEAAKITRIAASIATYTPKDFAPAVKALVKEKENDVKEYISETMSPRDYVTAGLKELAKAKDGVSRALARDLFYAATD